MGIDYKDEWLYPWIKYWETSLAQRGDERKMTHIWSTTIGAQNALLEIELVLY